MSFQLLVKVNMILALVLFAISFTLLMIARLSDRSVFGTYKTPMSVHHERFIQICARTGWFLAALGIIDAVLVIGVVLHASVYS